MGRPGLDRVRRAHAVRSLPDLLKRPGFVQGPRPLTQPAVEGEFHPPRGPLGDFSSVDWAAVIDSTWGPAVLSIPQMSSLFEAFWDEADRRFACFQDLEVDWNALHDRYAGEIGAGVSRGRFTAIMNHLSIALRESHTSAYDNLFEPVDSSAPRSAASGRGEVM